MKEAVNTYQCCAATCITFSGESNYTTCSVHSMTNTNPENMPHTAT